MMSALHSLPPAHRVDDGGYAGTPIASPVLTGVALRLLVGLVEAPMLSPLRSALLAKNGIIKVLEHTYIPEAPTFYPPVHSALPGAVSGGEAALVGRTSAATSANSAADILGDAGVRLGPPTS